MLSREIFPLGSATVSDTSADENVLGLRINLTPRARAIIKGLKLETGRTQQAVAERILEWFADQPAVVREAILSRTGDVAGAIARAREEAKAREGGQPVDSLAQAFEEAKSALRRAQMLALAERDPDAAATGGKKKRGKS